MADQYVVIVFDRWDDEHVSFVLEPCVDLPAAQQMQKDVREKIVGSFRKVVIEKCRTISQVPEWERV